MKIGHPHAEIRTRFSKDGQYQLVPADCAVQECVPGLADSFKSVCRHCEAPMESTLRLATTDESPAVARLYWSVWQATQAPLQPAGVAAMRDEAYFLDRVRGFP